MKTFGLKFIIPSLLWLLASNNLFAGQRSWNYIQGTTLCHPATFVIEHRNTGKRFNVTLKEPCKIVNMTSSQPFKAWQVADAVGLDGGKRFALLSYGGNCNHMSFTLYDNRFEESFKASIGRNNCQVINYNNKRPANIAASVAKYLGLHNRRPNNGGGGGGGGQPPRRRGFDLLGKSGNCNGMRYDIRDNRRNKVFSIHLNAPCQTINGTQPPRKIARQVAQVSGLAKRQRFAMLSYHGDCNRRTFRLYDKRRDREKRVSIGRENCQVIDYRSDRNPGDVAKQVAKYLGLGW